MMAPYPLFPPSKLVMNPMRVNPLGIQHRGNGTICSTLFRLIRNPLQKSTNSGSLWIRSSYSSSTEASSQALLDNTLQLNMSGPSMFAILS